MAALNKKLMKHGFKAEDEEVGTVIEFENRTYIVRDDGDKKVFAEYTEELDEESYDDGDGDKKVANVDEAGPSNKEKTTKTTKETKATKATKAIKEKQETKTKETKTKTTKTKATVKATEATEASEASDADKSDDPVPTEEATVKEHPSSDDNKADKAVKKTTKKTVKKNAKADKADKADTDSNQDTDASTDTTTKKKRRDPTKPKRKRDKTCHNVYVSEKMFELAKTMPELSGRDRFREVNKMWKEMPTDEKEERIAKYKMELAQRKAAEAVDASAEETEV